MKLVEIYGTPDCGFCKRAVKVCEANNIKYVYYDLSAKVELVSEMCARIGQPLRTVPQIFVDDSYVPGGYTGFAEYVNNFIQ
jgi:glutaredoxin 1